MNDRNISFAAGPSVLPVEVLRQVKEDLLNCNLSGMSAMEMSHRGKDFDYILDKTISDITELLQLDKCSSRFSILFAQGGATQQFSAVPLNLLQATNAKADYAISGQWSAKACQEAAKYGVVSEVFNTKSSDYRSIPDASTWHLSSDAKYFHYCSNETVNGVEFPCTPAPQYDVVNPCTDVPLAKMLVSDMSSNFLSRPISNLDSHAVIYAGAQKNVGPAGVTILLVRDDVVGKALSYCPTLLDYKTLKASNSVYNTPPVWSIYVVGLVACYLKQQGDLKYWDELSKRKSKLLYDVIDNSDGFYCNHIDKEFRSRMNIPFEIANGDEAIEKLFLCEAANRYKLVGLDGHRSVGGFRASLYNGMTLEDTETLASYMKEFQMENAE